MLYKDLDLLHNLIPEPLKSLNLALSLAVWHWFLFEDTHTLTQLADKEGAQRGFLMVILNVYIDDVHGL